MTRLTSLDEAEADYGLLRLLALTAGPGACAWGNILQTIYQARLAIGRTWSYRQDRKHNELRSTSKACRAVITRPSVHYYSSLALYHCKMSIRCHNAAARASEGKTESLDGLVNHGNREPLATLSNTAQTVKNHLSSATT